jgi:hypothetical protein
LGAAAAALGRTGAETENGEVSAGVNGTGSGEGVVVAGVEEPEERSAPTEAGRALLGSAAVPRAGTTTGATGVAAEELGEESNKARNGLAGNRSESAEVEEAGSERRSESVWKTV